MLPTERNVTLSPVMMNLKCHLWILETENWKCHLLLLLQYCDSWYPVPSLPVHILFFCLFYSFFHWQNHPLLCAAERCYRPRQFLVLGRCFQDWPTPGVRGLFHLFIFYVYLLFCYISNYNGEKLESTKSKIRSTDKYFLVLLIWLQTLCNKKCLIHC